MRFDSQVAQLFVNVTGQVPSRTFNNKNPRNETRTVKMVVNHASEKALDNLRQEYSKIYGERFIRIRNMRAVVKQKFNLYSYNKIVVCFKD